MAGKRGEADEALHAALRALAGAAEIDDAALATIRKGLERKSARIVEAAAPLVAEHQLGQLVALLAPAFAWCCEDPVKRDPGCRAKLAIVDALVRLERDPDDVLLAAVRYRQPEPTWGPPVDTATNLRGHAALGLAIVGHPDAAIEIARLLTDKEWNARAGAARALGAVPPITSEALLRFKALSGDAEPQVLGECFGALLAVAPAASLAFVAEFLAHADEAVAEQAAIALGESRREEALAKLISWRQRVAGAAVERAALVAIALVRSDASSAYLLGVLRDGEKRAAIHAAEALAIFKDDPRMRDAILAAAGARRDKAFLAKVREALG